MNESINQSINQSISQSVNQSKHIYGIASCVASESEACDCYLPADFQFLLLLDRSQMHG